MFGQRLAGFFAEAVHGVEHAVGQAGVLADPRQHVGRHRRPLSGLVHHGAAGCECGGDLPGRQHERRIPRRDYADRSDRHPGRDVPMLLARRVQPVARLCAFVGEEPEVLGGADRGLGHEAMRLASVDALQHGDIVGARLDRIGDRVQQLAPLGRRHVAPRRKRCLGGFGGAVDVRRRAARHLRQHRVVDRGGRLEHFAG